MRVEDKLVTYLTGATPHLEVLPPKPEGGSSPVHVKYGITLIYIKDVDISHHGYADVTISSYDNYNWEDSRLSWDPEQFGGIKSINIPIQKIWSPDIRCLNSLEAQPKADLTELAVVSHTGQVLFIPTAEHRVRCAATTQGHPDQDKWTCDFKFSSWTYDGYRLDVGFYSDKHKVDVEEFKEELSGYYIEENKGDYDRKFYSCCEEPYPSIKFTLGLCGKGKK